MIAATEFDQSLVQGNILRGYRYGRVRYLLLEVSRRDAARQFLAAAAAGGSDEVPAITSGAPWSVKPSSCFNIGLTYEGLRALGTPAASLATFPTEFIEGMTKRALKLGDFGDSAPDRWPKPFDQPERIHVIASAYAEDPAALDRIQVQAAKAFFVLGVRDGWSLPDNKVFFDYVDNLSQPKFAPVHDPEQDKVKEWMDPLGTVLLGHPTSLEGLRFRVPEPAALGLNGSFNAFRVLEQDVWAFETYLTAAAEELAANTAGEDLLALGDEGRIGKDLDRIGALREIVAAQMCGRWRNGVPYGASPNSPGDSEAISLTNFDYDSASRCPAGSHMRRANPRGGKIVQRIAQNTRRLVRRGMSYGPKVIPDTPDTEERGLLGNFIGASLGAQFEAVMCDWLNLGLQDPNITGANDPLIGANIPETSWFDLSLRNGRTYRLRGFPRFVTSRGGAYAFLPSLAAIRYLSQLRS